MKNLFIIVVLFCFIACPSHAKKKLYKWVDENGKVTYSNQVPPDQLKKEHQEINQDGVVLEKVSDIKTAEELQAERDEQKRIREEKKQAKKIAKQRANIIKAYTNEQEIIRLKDERMSAIVRNITSAKQSLDFQKTSREQLLSMAAANERSGTEVSAALKSRIVTIEKKIKYQKEFIENKQSEILKVKTKFDNDLQVYREAKNSEK